MNNSFSPRIRQNRSLLVVEDSNEDFEALQRFLRRSPIPVTIERCVNGEQALAFLYRTGSYVDRKIFPRPGLILLDLNLPGIDGPEVLRQIKKDVKLKTIPVVIFTTSNNPKDIEDCYISGANSYIIKPIDFAQLKRDVQILVDYWFDVATLHDLED
ncbi:MAG: response regulator [Microcoleus anatoxicus]|uniref:response regulator n=1 Tax=Microcoleus anatoxicus TaxID=2705319 RepID=UPI00366AE22F